MIQCHSATLLNVIVKRYCLRNYSRLSTHRRKTSLSWFADQEGGHQHLGSAPFSKTILDLLADPKAYSVSWVSCFFSFLFFLNLFIYLFIYLFMAVLGLRFCARAFPSCGKWGPLFITVHGPLTIAASLVAEHRLQTRRLSNCGSRAQLLWGMWDPPRPGLEPMSPALAGRFSTTAPPGKLLFSFLFKLHSHFPLSSRNVSISKVLFCCASLLSVCHNLSNMNIK